MNCEPRFFKPAKSLPPMRARRFAPKPTSRSSPNRVGLAILRTALAKRHLGRSEFKPFSDGRMVGPRPSSTSNSIVRRRTEIAGISDHAAAFLRGFF